MKNYKFSIVIPTFNSGKTIYNCILSCINQTYCNHEIIIIDDCSTDSTVEIVNELKLKFTNSDISINVLDINRGPSYARNLGVSMSSGDLISFLDSDDTYHKEKLRLANFFFNKYERMRLLVHDYDVENKSINTIIGDINNYKLNRKRFINLLIHNIAVTPSIVYKKEYLIKFNDKFRYAEDYDFLLRFAYKYGQIYKSELPLSRLNRELMSKGGLSENVLRMRLGEIRIYSSLYSLNPVFILLSPLLILFSSLKHLRKMAISILRRNL